MTEAEWKKMAKAWSKELSRYKLKSPESFSWKTNKSFGNKTAAIIGEMNHNLDKQIKGYMTKGWGLANKKNNALAAQYLKNFEIGTKEFPSFFNANVGALNQFVNRSINGLNLSANIWRNSDLALDILENYVGSGIAVGRSARRIAGDVMQVLKDPSSMMLHPPRGKYRSPLKNSMRMARTETNMAYRMADHLRYKQLDFVIGIEVHLSGQHPKLDICDSMTGKYPKHFQFLGWHPHCYCYQTSILASKTEFLTSVREKKPIPRASRIKRLPTKAQRYIMDNLDTMRKYKQLPYWVANNERFIAASINSPVRSTIDLQADRLMKKARAAGDEVYNISLNYANNFGGTTTDINYKSKSSIMRKARTELNGNIGLIKDSARTTVIVEAERIDEVVSVMRTDPRFTRGAGRIKLQTPDKFMGYKGVLANIETSSGLICEIQVLSPEMIFAKMPKKDAISLIGEKRWNFIKKKTGLEGGMGHKFYEQYRVLDKTRDAKKMQNIWTQSEEYYKNFHKSIPFEEAPVLPKTGNALMQDIIKTEKDLVLADFETAVVWNKDGNVVLKKAGGKRSVEFTIPECETFKDCIFTHNHPSGLNYARNEFGSIGNSFSNADLFMAAKWDVAEIRACTQRATFVIKRPPEGWPQVDLISRMHTLVKHEIKDLKLDALYARQGSLFYENPEYANVILAHAIMKELCRRLGIPYSKTVFRP
jgi:hypothetical protein